MSDDITKAWIDVARDAGRKDRDMEVHELRAEVERLRADSQQLNVLTEQWNIVTKAAREEIERLTADFLEYGNHKPDCRGGDGDNLCTCGYLMARAALEPKP
jgi:hypothetical protein